MNKKIIIFLVIVIGLALSISVFAYITNKTAQRNSIDSFEDCKSSGYPIQESYPERCAVPAGESFTNPDQAVDLPLQLLRECPDEWYEDRMPGPDPKEGNRQYFVIDGQRAELEDYDVEWIKNSCEVNKPSPVY